MLEYTRLAVQLSFEKFFKVARGEWSPDTYHRGVLSHAPENPAELVRTLRRMKGYRTVEVLGSALERNAPLVLPVLPEAVRGDGRARQFYESARLLQFSALPDWAHTRISEMVTEAFLKFDPTRHFPKEDDFRTKDQLRQMRDVLKDYWRQRRDDADRDRLGRTLPFELGLESFSTYSKFIEFTQLASRLPYRTTLRLGFSERRFREEINYFSVGNDGPLGRVALTTLQRCVSFMLSARIVDDLSRSLGNQLPAEVALLLIDSSTGPWRVFETKSGQRVRNLLEQLHTAETNLSDEAKHASFMAVLADRDPSPAAVRRRAASPEDTGAERATAEEKARRVHIAGYTEAIEIFHPQVEHSASVARKLARVQAKAGVTYSEIVGALREGRNPYDLMEDLYEQHLKLPRSGDHVGDHAPSPNGGLPAGTDNLPPESTALRIEIAAPDWQEIMTRLGRAGSDAIQARLFRMELGNLGEIKRLRGGIAEAIIDKGPGYRIYFTHLDGAITILLAGSKREQQQDINAARERRKALRGPLH